MQSASGTIALVGTLAYVLSFALGAGAVPGVLVSEINTFDCAAGQIEVRTFDFNAGGAPVPSDLVAFSVFVA